MCKWKNIIIMHSVHDFIFYTFTARVTSGLFLLYPLYTAEKAPEPIVAFSVIYILDIAQYATQ